MSSSDNSALLWDGVYSCVTPSLTVPSEQPSASPRCPPSQEPSGGSILVHNSTDIFVNIPKCSTLLFDWNNTAVMEILFFVAFVIVGLLRRNNVGEADPIGDLIREEEDEDVNLLLDVLIE